MERGIEQLFVLAVIVLAALIDLLARWLKRKKGKDQPAGVGDVDEEPVFVEEDDTELRERTWVEPQLPSPTPPSLRASMLPSAPAQRPTQPPRTVSQRRQQRARRWLTHPIDARRGIVLMAVLGPCRGLEAPQLGRD